MKPTYFLGLDAAKHKVRIALRGPDKRFHCEKDLPVSAAGCRELLALLSQHLPQNESLLVLIEATGVLHCNWAAALTKAGYAVAVINPLMARRLYTLKNSIRENKTDPVDARGLCALAALYGSELVQKYRFTLQPERLALQRLETVRKAVRNALTNLKKTYASLLDISFPELGGLMKLDGVGLRELLLEAPSPAAIARKRLSSLESNWMLRPKAARLKTLARDSIADPELAAASAPAVRGILQSIAAMEARLAELAACNPERKQLIQNIPGFGPATVAKVIAYLPEELLHSGSNRTAATRLQAFMGNDPRLKESGQWKGLTKMSKRGVEMLRTAFFQAAFTASQHDPELKAFYQRKRSVGQAHKVALSHLMRILTRRMVAVLRSGKPYQSNLNFALQNAA
jgi:transposase